MRLLIGKDSFFLLTAKVFSWRVFNAQAARGGVSLATPLFAQLLPTGR
jgi:hypothetical protein